MIDGLSLIVGGVISFIAILLGNIAQSKWERRKKIRSWYLETASLADQIYDIYERRKQVSDDRARERAQSDQGMNSAVIREIQKDMRKRFEQLVEHSQTDIPIDPDFRGLIDELDELLVRSKREGIDENIDNIGEVCEELKWAGYRRASRYDSSWNKLKHRLLG